MLKKSAKPGETRGAGMLWLGQGNNVIRRISSKILLVVFGGLLGLAAVQVTFYLVPLAFVQKLPNSFLFRSHPAPWMMTADERFGWAFVPGSSFTSAGKGEFQVQVGINSKGLRDREIPYQKEPNVFRILVLGDSFSAALQVPLDHAWHKVAEIKLNEHPRIGKKIEFINSGVPGYGTTQELLYYRYEGHKYNPDLILLQIYPNDVDEIYQQGRERAHRARAPFFVLNGEQLELKNFPFRRLAHRVSPVSQTFPFLAYLFRPLMKEANKTLKPPELSKPPELPDLPARLLLMYASPAPPGFEEAWEMEARLIRELAKESAQHGTKLLAVLIPERYRVYPFLWSELVGKYPKMKEMEWDLDLFNRRLGALLRQAGIGYLDLMPALREYANKIEAALYFRKDGHFTAEGNRVAGELLYAWLLDQGLIPES